MKSSNNINSGGVYEPVNNTAGNVGWGDEFGTIRWQSVLTPYADGQTKGATIPAGTVYKDSLSVIKWGNKIRKMLPVQICIHSRMMAALRLPLF